MMRRIVDLRGRLDVEKRQQQWEYMARALRAFYVNERIYPELLKLDQAIAQAGEFGRVGSPAGGDPIGNGSKCQRRPNPFCFEVGQDDCNDAVALGNCSGAQRED